MSASKLMRAGQVSVLAACLICLMGGSALAAKTHNYSGKSFGPDGTTKTSFEVLSSVAVDQATENVFVFDGGSGGRIFKFSSSGAPLKFSGLSGNVIESTGTGGYPENELAIAPKGALGETAGDIYLANNAVVKVYSPAGTLLGELAGDGEVGQEACGVATDPGGHVFVGFYPKTVREYTPKAGPVSGWTVAGQSVASLSSICNVAADGLGHIYATEYFGGNTARLNGIADPNPATIERHAATLTVNASNNNVLLAASAPESGVFLTELTASGEVLGSSGKGEAAHPSGVAVNSATGTVYVGDAESGKVLLYGPPVVVPTTTTEPATAVLRKNATLNATVNPSGLAVSKCTFEYGPTSKYGSTAPCEQALPNDAADHKVTLKLSGLTGSTIYHFRITAENANGSSSGIDREFTTASQSAVTGEATSVGATTATVRGTLNPEGISYSACAFEVGSTSAYGIKVPCVETTASIGSGFEPVPVHADLANLNPGSVYHYRLVGTNSTEAEYGSDRTFKTLGPVIEFEGVLASGLTEATVQAGINPKGSATTYRLEYGLDSSYGTKTAETAVGSDETRHVVSQSLKGLAPGTTYHYRFVATNGVGASAGEDRTFTTLAATSPCPNESLRVEPSLRMPDCRAYERVSPGESGKFLFPSAGYGVGVFESQPSTTDGNRFVYTTTEGALLPGGNGFTDSYESVRTPDGWKLVRSRSPSGQISEGVVNGGTSSSDLQYSVWIYNRNGQVSINIGRPDGSFEYAGRGSLGVDPGSEVWGISPGGDQIVFETGATSGAPPTVALEPGVEEGHREVYERSIDGPTHVVSLLPGGEPAEEAKYRGKSSDGTTIFFRSIERNSNGEARYDIWARVNAQKTVPVASEVGENQFSLEGVSASGDQAIYQIEPLAAGLEAEPGNIYSRDLVSNTTTPITTTGDALVTRVSPDAGRVYFTSPSILVPSSAAISGQRNLYLWTRATNSISFVATIEESDQGLSQRDSVGNGRGEVGRLATRITADGSVLAFISQARLTSYDNNNLAEVYLYRVGSGIECASCNPSGAPATFGAEFQDRSEYGQLRVSNLSEDGTRVFFQTRASLVPADTAGGGQDVYEWSAATGPRLITTGTNPSPNSNSIVGITPSGNDVYFYSNEVLAPRTQASAFAIYDARVGGGFEEPLPGCEGEGCRGQGSIPAAPAGAPTTQFVGPGNPKPQSTCKVKASRKHKKNKKNKCHRKKQKKSGKGKKKKKRAPQRSSRGGIDNPGLRRSVR